MRKFQSSPSIDTSIMRLLNLINLTSFVVALSTCCIASDLLLSSTRNDSSEEKMELSMPSVFTGGIASSRHHVRSNLDSQLYPSLPENPYLDKETTKLAPITYIPASKDIDEPPVQDRSNSDVETLGVRSGNREGTANYAGGQPSMSSYPRQPSLSPDGYGGVQPGVPPTSYGGYQPGLPAAGYTGLPTDSYRGAQLPNPYGGNQPGLPTSGYRGGQPGLSTDGYRGAQPSASFDGNKTNWPTSGYRGAEPGLSTGGYRGAQPTAPNGGNQPGNGGAQPGKPTDGNPGVLPFQQPARPENPAQGANGNPYSPGQKVPPNHIGWIQPAPLPAYPGYAGYGASAGYAPPGYGPYGYAPPGYAPPGYAPPNYAPPGYGPPGYAPPGYTAPGHTPPGYATPGYGRYENHYQYRSGQNFKENTKQGQ